MPVNQNRTRASGKRRGLVALLSLVISLLTLSLLNAPGASAAGWVFLESDSLSVQSKNGRAKATREVRWYHGEPPKGYRHRGNYTASSRVEAKRSVGCIWAKVSFGYPSGSITVGSGGGTGSISPAQKEGDYYWSCRRAGQRYPRPLLLGGVGYARAFLNSTTIEVCTSSTKADGPRFCAWEKNVYGGR